MGLKRVLSGCQKLPARFGRGAVLPAACIKADFFIRSRVMRKCEGEFRVRQRRGYDCSACGNAVVAQRAHRVVGEQRLRAHDRVAQ